jgi:polyisoprenoid-binding protein YceI
VRSAGDTFAARLCLICHATPVALATENAMTCKRPWIATPLFLLAASFAGAENYTIDSDHTRPTFEISHFGYSTFRGRFDRTTGRISYDPAARTGSADVRVEVGSVSTGVSAIDEHLKKPEFFDAAKFPAITFKSTQFVFDGERLASVDGNLTIRDVTKPVSLKVGAVNCRPHPIEKHPVCGADAQVTLKRSDFGVKAYLPTIGDEVTLLVAVEAANKPAKK